MSRALANRTKSDIPDQARDVASTIADERRSGSLISIGYTVLDLVESDGFSPRAGGTAANVAANVSWLGGRSELVARLGQDWAGKTLSYDLKDSGVDVSFLELQGNVETPLLVHRTLANGDPKYLFSCPQCRRKFASHRPAEMAVTEHIDVNDRTVLFADRASAAALLLMARVRAAGGTVIFEPNGVGRPSLTYQALALADIIKISDDRWGDLYDLIASSATSARVVRTSGPNGVTFTSASGHVHRRRAARATVLDSAGAGDWVTAGIIARLLADPDRSHTSLSSGLQLGQWLAARSCEFVGARGMNLHYEVGALLSGRPVPAAARVTRHNGAGPSPARGACDVCRR